MSSSRSRDQNPPTPAGVRVIVRDRPQPEPKREPAPSPPFMGPDAVVVPEDMSPEDLRAFLDSLCKEHSDFVMTLLGGRRDLQEASAKDVHQRVFLVLMNHVEQRKPIGHVRRFLTGVAHNVILEHKRERVGKLPIDRGAEVDGVSASTTDPEGKVTRAELRARIGVYVSRLPPELAQVVRVMDFLGMTVQQAHVALGRPPSTISWQHARAREMLEEMVLASERGSALAAQLRK